MGPYIGRRALAIRFIRGRILAPTAIGSIIYYLASRLDLAHKPLLVMCGVIIGWPIKFSLGARYEGWHRARRARVLGAVTASESRGKLFGDIDAVQEIQRINKNGFVGRFTRLVRERTYHVR